jgi:hypothetical protein
MGSSKNDYFPATSRRTWAPQMGPVAKMGGQIDDTGSKLHPDRRCKTTGPPAAREERF